MSSSDSDTVATVQERRADGTSGLGSSLPQFKVKMPEVPKMPEVSIPTMPDVSMPSMPAYISESWEKFSIYTGLKAPPPKPPAVPPRPPRPDPGLFMRFAEAVARESESLALRLASYVREERWMIMFALLSLATMRALRHPVRRHILPTDKDKDECSSEEE